MSESDKRQDDGMDSDIGDEEMEEELALPALLSDIGDREKRELLIFKRTHNERDWEEEILRRTDLLARKVDMERLKRMTKGFSVEKPTSTTKAAKKTTPRGKRGKVESEDEDDEDDVEYEDAPTKKRRVAATKATTATAESDEEGLVGEDEDGDDDFAAAMDDDDDDDDEDDELFDSDEEEEISKRYQQGGASALDDNEEGDGTGRKVRGKTLGQKNKSKAQASAASGPRRSGRKVPKKDDYDDDEDEGDAYDDQDDDEDRRKTTRRPSTGKRLSKSRGADKDDDEMDVDGDDSDGEHSTGSSDGEAGGRIKKEKVDNSPPASLDHYLRIQSRRFAIERWLGEPYLEEVLVGSFVRLFIGEIEGQKVYRMCEVTAVERNSKPYKLPDTGKMVTVRMTVSIAGVERTKQKIDVVSNSRITAIEFAHYKSKVDAVIAANNGQPVRGVSMLTENQVTARRQKQLKASRHVYTHQEIRAMVAKKSGLNKSLVTEYSTAMESLQKKLAEAKEEKDVDAVRAVQRTIDLLEAESARQKEANAAASRHHIEVNKRSRESNVQRDMAAGIRKRQEELEAAASGKLSNAVLDPFLRRETRPKILWNTGSKLKNEQAKDSGAVPVSPKGSTTAAAAASSTTASGPAKSTAISAAESSVGQSSGGRGWTIVSGDTSLDEVRKRVKAKLGFDPYSVFLENPRERYLRKVCSGLPPPGSAERAALRGNNRSLEEVIDQVRAQREQQAHMDAEDESYTATVPMQ